MSTSEKAAKWQNTLLSIVIVVAAAFTLLGTNGKVDALTAKVASLETQIVQVDRIERKVDALNRRLVQVRRTVSDLRSIRDELFDAIERIADRGRR